MKFIKSDLALNYIKNLPKRDKPDWKQFIPDANPLAYDLLSKMLTFNPEKRITIDECIIHPYLAECRDKEDEDRISTKTFDWNFDSSDLSIEEIREMIYDEIIEFQKNKKPDN